MSSFLNDLGIAAGRTGALMLMQTALLVLALLLLELAFGRRIRASVRCALWLLVVVKLVLPPTLMFPTGVGFWVGPWLAPPIRLSPPARLTVIRGTPDSAALIGDFNLPVTTRVTSAPLTPTAWALLAWMAGSIGLGLWMVRRNREVYRLLRAAEPAPPEFLERLREAADRLGVRH